VVIERFPGIVLLIELSGHRQRGVRVDMGIFKRRLFWQRSISRWFSLRGMAYRRLFSVDGYFSSIHMQKSSQRLIHHLYIFINFSLSFLVRKAVFWITRKLGITGAPFFSEIQRWT